MINWYSVCVQLAFSRYFLPEYLPADYEGRAVYLDDDIIVQGEATQIPLLNF